MLPAQELQGLHGWLDATIAPPESATKLPARYCL